MNNAHHSPTPSFDPQVKDPELVEVWKPSPDPDPAWPSDLAAG